MSTRANGEGSVWKRKDGRWCAGAYVPVAGGGVRRVYAYGRTRQDANRKLRELLDRTEKHIPVAPASLTVASYLEDWLVHIRQHVRPTTYAGYESNVRLHLSPRIGRKKLVQLGPREVRTMIDDMRASGMKPRSIQYVHATLRNALEHAYREEVVSRNVARLVRIEQPTKLKPTEPMTVDEARAFLDAVRTHRLYAMWTVILMLGLRRSEVCGLRWEHIDFAAGTLRVAQSVQRVEGQLQVMPTKSKRSNRTVPLPSRCRYALAEHHARLQRRDGRIGIPGRPSGYVFGTTTGTPLEPRNLTRMFRALCEANGIRVVRLHDLRHTCVSLLLAQGVHPRVVMEIVGHSAIEMTMNVYGHVNLDTQRQALDDLDSGLSDDADS